MVVSGWKAAQANQNVSTWVMRASSATGEWSGDGVAEDVPAAARLGVLEPAVDRGERQDPAVEGGFEGAGGADVAAVGDGAGVERGTGAGLPPHDERAVTVDQRHDPVGFEPFVGDRLRSAPVGRGRRCVSWRRSGRRPPASSKKNGGVFTSSYPG